MNNLELAFATKSFTSDEDVVTLSKNETNRGFDKLTEDQLLLIGGGDSVVFW
ncbi:MAG: hypothetical protein H7232_05095 [Aeromicrobium sp.]|nr:hypothetical protein [Burkholderiales bacterium]